MFSSLEVSHTEHIQQLFAMQTKNPFSFPLFFWQFRNIIFGKIYDRPIYDRPIDSGS